MSTRTPVAASKPDAGDPPDNEDARSIPTHACALPITGAAQGIARAYARRLTADGLRAVAADLNSPDETVALIAADGGRAHAVRCDITSEASVEARGREVTERFGGADVLVNNAMTYAFGPIDELSFDDWPRVLAVGLNGTFLVSRAFVPGMRDRGWGRIVNISSNTFGLVLPSTTAYVTAKAGVLGFTRALASELGPHGITVNCIAPGLTQTPQTEAMGDVGFFEQMVARQSIPRVAVPDDLVGTLSFLASEDSAFLTGQTLVVDGGLVRH